MKSGNTAREIKLLENWITNEPKKNSWQTKQVSTFLKPRF